LRRKRWWTVPTALVLVVLLSGLALGQGTVPGFGVVQQVYDDLMQGYVDHLSGSTLAQGAIDGMLATLHDPFTEYLSPQAYQGFQNELSNKFVGIGVELAQENGAVVVTHVFPNSPASQAGVQPQDRITAVNGESVQGMSLSQVADLIRGSAGTPVTLQIGRGTVQLSFTLTRSSVTVPEATYQLLPGSIGYIQLSVVGAAAPSQLQSALSALQAQGARGYILDLRGNPGGYVSAAVAMAQDFIPSGTVVKLVGRDGVSQTLSASQGRSVGPLVVLVDGGTASAAEILTAALEEDVGATVVGTRTYGKGSAQTVLPLQNGGVLKMTIARWYTPDGQNVNGVGIPAQYVVTGDRPPIDVALNLLGVTKTWSVDLTLGSTAGTAEGGSLTLPAAPYLADGQAYLPLAATAGALGAQVQWDATAGAVVLKFKRSKAVLPVGGSAGLVDGASVSLPSPVVVRHGMSFAPLGAFRAALGATVSFDPTTGVVTLTE
jgi:carboxyl-terminal processing protease